MKAVFLATLGTSDIGLDGQRLSAPPSFLSETEKIHKKLNEYKSQLSLPLLDPSLKKAIEICRGMPELIFLFYTKQEPIRQDDTYIAAQIIKEILKEKWENIQIKLIYIDRLPYHYGEMIAFFNDFFEDRKRDFSEVENCFLAITGGTPAMSVGLLYAGTLKFGEKAKVIYLPKGRNVAEQIDAPQRVLSFLWKEELISYCRRYNYTAALEIAERIPYLREKEALRLLIEAAHSRMLLDFDGALNYLLEAEPSVTRLPAHKAWQSWLEDLRELTSGSFEKLIGMLFFSASIYLKCEDFASFLYSLFSLMEGLLGWQLDRATGGGISLKGGERKRNEAFFKYMEKHSAIEGRFREKGVDISLGLN